MHGARYYFPLANPHDAWTLTAADGTVTFTPLGVVPASEPKATLALHVNTTVTGQVSAAVAKKQAIRDPDRYDVAVRFQFGAGNGNALAEMWLSVGSVGVLGPGGADDNSASVIVTGDGDLRVDAMAGASPTAVMSASGAYDNGERTGFYAWLRVVRSPLGFAVYKGVGTNEGLPTEWLCIATTLDATSGAAARSLLAKSQGYGWRIGALTTGSIVGGFSPVILDVATWDPGARSPLTKAAGEAW